MKTSARLVAWCLLVLAALAGPSGAQGAAGFQVVVHASNPVTTLSRTEVARMFLKKTTLWDKGRTIDPVDLGPDDKTRERFSREVLGKEIRQVQSYWQRMIFSGRATPPPALASDGEVLDFVAADPQAIGYVPAGSSIGRGVKSVTITD